MSDGTAKLVVDPGNPAFRVEVYDSTFAMAASGYGRVEKKLSPGLYKIRYLAADARQEQFVVLQEGNTTTIDDAPELQFASAAPLEMTWTSHEYHQANAERLSRQTPLERGAGGELLLFVRDVHSVKTGHPTENLSLHRLNGEMVVHFKDVTESGGDEQIARWAGRNISVDPGVYRLRLRAPSEITLELPVVVCPGWQSQVFLCREGGECEIAGQVLPDFGNAAQLMARVQSGFQPHMASRRVAPEEAGEDLRLLELARQSLASGRRGISSHDLRAMLKGKWHDPLLGILAVHLLLMQPEPDLKLAQEVLERVQNEIGRIRHPDVELLVLEVNEQLGQASEIAPLVAPPMLRRSWDILVRATIKHRIIEPSSLPFQIADRIRECGAWLVWELPKQPSAPEAEPATSTSKWFHHLVKNVAKTVSQKGIQDFLDRVVLDNVEVPKREQSKKNWLDEIILLGSREFRSAASNDDVDTDSSDSTEPNASSDPIALGGPVAYSELRQELEALIPKLQRPLEQLGIDQLSELVQLNDDEYSLLVYLQTTIVYQFRFAKLQRDLADPLTLSTLVNSLLLPAERIQRAVVGFVVKCLAAAQSSTGVWQSGEKQNAPDSKPAPELANQQAVAAEGWGVLEEKILAISVSRPASLRRLLQSYGHSLYRAAGGANETDFIAATLVGGETPVRLPSNQFTSGKDAYLSGYGPGELRLREGLVRFAHGDVMIDMEGFPTDESWGLYCLSSEKDPAEAEYREVFAIRWGAMPDPVVEPFDLIETGHLASAQQSAQASGWAGSKLDALKIVAAVRMESLIEQAVADIKTKGWLAAEHQYLLKQFEESGGRTVTGTVQAIGSRLRGSKGT